MVRLEINRSQVRLLAIPLSCNDTGQVYASVTKQYNLVPAKWQ